MRPIPGQILVDRTRATLDLVTGGRGIAVRSQAPGSRRVRPVALLGIALAALLVMGVVVVVRTGDDPAGRTSSSSATPSSDVDSLLAAGRADGPASRDAAWRSDGQTVGAWVQVDWPEARSVGRVAFADTGGADGVSSVRLTYDDGTAVLVTAGIDGTAAVDLPVRSTSSIRLTVAALRGTPDSVALAWLTLGADGGSARAAAEVSASASSSSGPGPEALVDGDPRTADPGQEWVAAPGDTAPWAQVDLGGPQLVTAVQVLGPTETGFDPASSAAAQLNGRLVFDDGSEVVVSGIAGGDTGPSTIAFTPRLASSVRIELARTIAPATLALREVVVYSGDTPVRWDGRPGVYSVASPSPQPCSRDSDSVSADSATTPRLVCPAPGSSVGGLTTVVAAATPGATLQARAWQSLDGSPSGSISQVASAVAGSDGRAELVVDTARLPHGPVAIQVSAAGPDPAAPLYVQVVNRDGVDLPARSTAPEGSTLQWDEEFTGPLAVSATGTGTTYAGTKPAKWGPSDFGDAVFADPAAGAENLATLDDEYLRIRVSPIDGLPVGAPYGQEHVGGILSSLQVGASGFAAQYGYFEARMTGGPGLGSWPAFWMLNSQSATADDTTAGEVDAVELYGQFPGGSCHTVHSWDRTRTDQDGSARCSENNGFDDWPMTWHVYGVQVEPGGATFLIDGEVVAHADGLSRTDEPFFFMVDLALGGGWPVDLSPTGEVTDLYVDWVRVYT